ncbi:MAG: TonB family protein [Dysgonamonadaceae bacterium]|jgi:protein TonB|nr:TonB family protein [Dysgonamonadaceae bacterium]
MTKDIDLTSREWLNLVFEGKNKEYGAYELRESSSDRHIKALVIVIVGCLLFICLSRLVNSVVHQQSAKVVQNAGIVMSAIPEIQEKTTVAEIKVVPPPSPEVKKAIQFTPPVIRPDDLIDGKKQIATQIELTMETGVISNTTTDGVLIGGVDPAVVTEIIGEPAAEPVIHKFVEVPPTPAGGEKELMKWLAENIIYPAIAIEKGIEGRVIVGFVVGTDGSISNVEVVKPLDPSCDKEAVRVVKKMPKWIPGKQNGNKVYVYYTLPILFKLQK